MSCPVDWGQLQVGTGSERVILGTATAALVDPGLCRAELHLHLICYSTQFASGKERKMLAKALRLTYTAADTEAAATARDEVERGP